MATASVEFGDIRFGGLNGVSVPIGIYGLLAMLAMIGVPNASFAEAPRLSIPKTTTPPSIDGVLDDDVWKQAVVTSAFYQRVPVEGAPASEKTVAYLAYDSDMIYVGARLYDRTPDQISASELREDSDGFTDDAFTVAIDSLLDRRNAFSFSLYASGAKVDARIEENIRWRAEWDGIWYGAAVRDEAGWVAEFAIPFKTLSLRPDADVWGLELERYIPRRNEFSLWANYDQDRDLTYVAAYGDLSGLRDLDQGMGLDVKPQLATRSRRRFNPDNKDFLLKPGAELVYKVRPSLNASLIVNPDFSNAVVDDIKTNLTRFDLFFPEQRDFFVRDADIFQFGGLSEANGIPFFSRRIGLPFDIENPEPLDIDAGAKLSGRVGRYTLGLLNTQMGSGQGINSKNLSVARVAADIQRESRVGAILTYGNPTSNDDNGVAGVDYRFRNSEVFGSKVFVADAFFMKSFSAGIDADELAYGVTLDYPNDRWNGKVSYTEIQRNFNPALGFANRTGIRRYVGELRFRKRPDGNRYVRSANWGFKSEFITNTDNQLESSHIWLRIFELEGHEGDEAALWVNWEHETLFQPFEIQRGVVIPIGDYDFYTAFGKLVTAPFRPVSGEVRFKIGEFYDGDLIDLRARVEWRPSPHFYITLERRTFDIDLPHGDFAIAINRARFNVNFTPTISWTNYLQQETENHIMTLQSQLRWIIVPGNELTLTLNHDWAREGGSYKSTETDFFTRLVWTHRF